MLRYLNLLLLIALAVVAHGYAEAIGDPILRRATVHMDNWPPGTPPLRVVLISDLHVVGPDTPPGRIAGIVDRINRLEPDLVLIAGDFTSTRGIRTRGYSIEQVAAVLSRLRARLGVVGVPGNHDFIGPNDKGGPVRAVEVDIALAHARVTILRNTAIRRGPLTIGGADDWLTLRFRPDALRAAMEALPGPTILLTHVPDIAATFDGPHRLVLAGHTHCGQIVPPFYGPIATGSAHGMRYLCGITRERGRQIIVTAGIGTSVVPFRWGAPPDFWLLTLTGPRAAAAPASDPGLFGF